MSEEGGKNMLGRLRMRKTVSREFGFVVLLWEQRQEEKRVGPFRKCWKSPQCKTNLTFFGDFVKVR